MGLASLQLYASRHSGRHLGDAHPDSHPQLERQRRRVLQLYLPPAGRVGGQHADHRDSARLCLALPGLCLGPALAAPVQRVLLAWLLGGDQRRQRQHVELAAGRRYRPVRQAPRGQLLRVGLRGRRRSVRRRRRAARGGHLEPRGRHGRRRGVGDDRAAAVPRPSGQAQHRRRGTPLGWRGLRVDANYQRREPLAALRDGQRVHDKRRRSLRRGTF